MKNIFKLLIPLILIFSQISYSQDRSPFDEPVRTRNLYDYMEAKKHCIITGIITTQKGGTAILKLNENETASVYLVNDKISIKNNGIIHEFTLIEIKDRAIVLKGKNTRAYEVELR